MYARVKSSDLPVLWARDGRSWRSVFTPEAIGTSFSGEILKEDKPVRYKRVSEAIDDGLAYATEDRKAAGLVLGESVCDNIVLSSLKKLSNRGVRNRSLEIREAQAKAKELNVKCPTIYQKTVNLSGGNQQKVVLARWILTAPDVLILDEPTRGIDVVQSAKYTASSMNWLHRAKL